MLIYSEGMVSISQKMKWQLMDEQPIHIPKPSRLFNEDLIRIDDTTTTPSIKCTKYNAPVMHNM